MKTEVDYVEYETQMPSPFGYQDPMEMYQKQQAPQGEVPPQFYLQNFHQSQWMKTHQNRFPSPMQHPTASNFQPEPPPLHYTVRPPNPQMNSEQNRPFLPPQYRAQHMHEQQIRHQHMLQQNMMRMQNHMMQRHPARMQPPGPGHRVPIEQSHRIPIEQSHMHQQQWRFHNMRSPVTAMNHSNYTPTPPPMMPLECQLSETPGPPTENIQEMDDFQDFDVTDLLRLSFGDENEYNSRKRKGSKSSYDVVPMKKYRRTKAELIADRNRKLMQQCKKMSIFLPNLALPEHVRIFGKNILRENLPNVPNMKLSPKNIDFIRVRNIGYLVTKKGICFSCMSDQCRFKSYETDRFKEHLKTYHFMEGCGSTEGFCKICEKHCCGYSPEDEVHHVLTVHVRSVERHPMHQILYSHVKKPINFKENNESNLIENEVRIIDDDEIFEKPKRRRRKKNQEKFESDDEDFNPNEVDDEQEDDEIDTECEEIPDELEMDDSENELLSEEFLSLSDEEQPVFDTSSESENSNSEWQIVKNKHGKTDDKVDKSDERTTETKSDDDAFEEVPIYMLNRIKLHASIKGLENEEEPSVNKKSFTEVIEDILKDENLVTSPNELNHKKKKLNFARKRTAASADPHYEYKPNNSSLTDLPPCRVLLQRLEDTLSADQNEPECVKSDEKNDLKTNKTIAVPINIPTPPLSENSRDSFPSPVLNKSSNPIEQNQKDLENDSGFSDHSVSNKSAVSEDNDMKKFDNEMSTDSNKNLIDEAKCKVENNNIVSEINESVPKVVVAEKMRTRNSNRLQRQEKGNDEGISIDDKENSGRKTENNEITKNTESPKSIQSPRKLSRPKVVKRQRFVRKFHKIDSFFPKTSESGTNENTVMENHQHVDETEVIEIDDSPDLLADTDVINISTLEFSLDLENEDKELINLCDEYPWIDRSISATIFKSKNCLEILRKEPTKFSTFKCMERHCSYFTIDFEKFKTHISMHKRDHYCSYCLFNGNDSETLIKHIESNHKLDRYQCGLCMYRAAEKVYVEWHQRRHHTCPNGVVLKSPTQFLMKSARNQIQEQLKNENLKKYVHPYKCKTHECDKEFYSKSNYVHHLKLESESPDLSQHINEICEQLIEIDQTRTKTHKEGCYQCLYCVYGSDKNIDIYNHMADVHPTKLGFICRRLGDIGKISEDKTTVFEVETLESQTRIDYIGACSYKIKIFKGDIDRLTEKQNETELKDGDLNKTNPEIISSNLDSKSLGLDNNNLAKATPSSFPIISKITHIDSF